MTKIKTLLSTQIVAPDPPQWLIDFIDKVDIDHYGGTYEKAEHLANDIGFQILDEKKRNFENYNNRVLLTKGQKILSGHNHYNLNEDGFHWSKKNISSQAIDLRCVFSTPNKSIVGPHTDQSRKWTLIYLIRDGGPNHRTVFYQEKEVNDIIRDPGYFITDYNRIEEIGSVKLSLNRWTLINASVLHSIENIPESRCSIQVSFNDFPSDLIFKNSIYYEQ